MKTSFFFSAFLCLATAMSGFNTAHAQSLEASASASTAEALPATEAHIRQGIILLNELNLCLAAVDNQQKADDAAVKVFEYQRKLTQWGQGFSALAKDDIEVQKSYEKAYMPIIQKINDALQIQSLRLSAAEYYQSKNLAAALVNIVEATN